MYYICYYLTAFPNSELVTSTYVLLQIWLHVLISTLFGLQLLALGLLRGQLSLPPLAVPPLPLRLGREVDSQSSFRTVGILMEFRCEVVKTALSSATQDAKSRVHNRTYTF